MSEYRVNFFNVTTQEVKNEDGSKVVTKADEYVGSVVVDDSGVDNVNLTLASKAYRHAPQYTRASKLIIEKLQ